MAYDPTLSTDRDALRFFLGDTNDAAPEFGLDEDGYDAVIARFGLVNTALMLIDQKIAALGPQSWSDGDVSLNRKSLWEFWMQKRQDVMDGKLLPAGGTMPAVVSVGAIDGPDLTGFETLP